MGQIVTFFSYKGGVGRSMAVANVAVLLAKWGKKVLAIDWDLEAPGLESFFKECTDAAQVHERHGLVDILGDYYHANKAPEWRNSLVEVALPDARGSLHLLTAGRRDAEYFQRVRALDLTSFYTDKQGAFVVEKLRDEWKTQFDYVLVDSRTGATELGGICTVQLPDLLVLLFVTTEQSFVGAIDIAQKAAAVRHKLPFERLRIPAIPIPSRFDTQTEFEISKEWLGRFASGLGDVFSDWLPSSVDRQEMLELIKLPYVSYFSFGEKLPVLEQGTSDPAGLGYAYETLAALIGNNLERVDILVEDRDDFVRLAQSCHKGAAGSLWISYSSNDKPWLDRVMTHMGPLSKRTAASVWSDSDIVPGESWYSEIKRSLENAAVAVLLLSPDYLSSPWATSKELTGLLERYRTRSLRIVPIVIRPCAWEQIGWLADRQVLPRSGRALSQESDSVIDQGIAGITREIVELLEEPSVASRSASTTARQSTGPAEHVDTFICYSRADQNVARQIATSLQSRELSVWFDEWELTPGQAWQAAIDELAEASHSAVVLVGEGGGGAPWDEQKVRATLRQLVTRKSPVIPVLLPGASSKTALPLFLQELSCVDLREGVSENGVDAIVWGITGRKPHRIEVSPSRLPAVGKLFVGRSSELRQLTKAWDDPKTNVVSIIGWDGVGKTTLISRWRENMARREWRGAERVFDWSFYSQGSRDLGDASADAFIDTALRWFGDSDVGVGSPWDKGERLAKLVRNSRTLLILDGTEPLQNPPGPQGGGLKDPALRSLIRSLADTNKGLLILTTRIPIRELEGMKSALQMELSTLSTEAGGKLLRRLGVRGTESELEAASQEVEGHALALNLLGNYLRDVCDGDVSRRHEVRLLEQDYAQGGHAYRVLASYEDWFADGPEVRVLRMLGIFDRPVGNQEFGVLRAAPEIPGLTDGLGTLSAAEWAGVLARLRTAQLLAADGTESQLLDTHPLIREYFRGRLRDLFPLACKEGHLRMFEYLRNSTVEQPETLEEMLPLFSAMAHGCQAGCFREAWDDIYIPRISRGTALYHWRRLGAFGQDLATLSHFFERTWKEPVQGLEEDVYLRVLNRVGVALPAVGRFAEAVEPLTDVLRLRAERKEWRSCAINGCHLSHVHLITGNLEQSLALARTSAEHSERSGDDYLPIATWAHLGHVLHQTGRLQEAEEAFQKAEKLQRLREPKCGYLYSVPGYQYCDFLLDQEKYEEVLTRTEEMRKWTRDKALSLRSRGLVELVTARAQSQETREVTGDPESAKNHINQALMDLRQSGQLDYVPLGLLVRAMVFRMMNRLGDADADVHECVSLCERYAMQTFLVDCYLERAHSCFFRDQPGAAQRTLLAAQDIINRTGYTRRLPQVTRLLERLNLSSESLGR